MQTRNILFIKSINPGSEAENAGLKVGDIIVEYNDEKINGELSTFRSLIKKTEGEDNITLKVLRDDQEISLVVKGGKLGVTVTEQQQEILQTTMTPEEVEPAARFHTLLGLGKFLSGSGWVVVIIGVVSLVVGIANGGDGGLLIALGSILLAIIGLLMIANGEVISCFVAIEKNTRATSELLEKAKGNGR